jgi:hypothetical protein
LLSILHDLETLECRGTTRISGVLEELSHLIRKRSLVVLISDFYEEVGTLMKALRFFHHRGNDVLLFHIFDPLELELPLAGTSTLEDLETGQQIPFSSEHSRGAYLTEVKNHIRALRKECSSTQIDYELMSTGKPLDQALYRYLSARSRRI